jgi:hypothetical protein
MVCLDFLGITACSGYFADLTILSKGLLYLTLWPLPHKHISSICGSQLDIFNSFGWSFHSVVLSLNKCSVALSECIFIELTSEQMGVLGCGTNRIAACDNLLTNYKLGAAFTREDGKYHDGFHNKHYVQQKHGDVLSARRVKIFEFKSLLTDVFGHISFASAVDNASSIPLFYLSCWKLDG